MSEAETPSGNVIGTAFLSIEPVGSALHITGFTDPNGVYTPYEPTRHLADLP